MTDDDLRARLRGADPGASLPPADPQRVARLLEDVMATELTDENRATGVRQRGPLTWLVAAVAVLVIAGAGFLGLRVLSGDDDAGPGPVAAPTPSVTELTGPAAGAGSGAGSGRCMMPNAETLASFPTAFAGTVTSVDDDRVTLDVDHWYAGTPTDTVLVAAPGEQWETLLSAVHFEEGGRYLVAAGETGAVAVCGFSAAYDDDLAALYDQAFS